MLEWDRSHDWVVRRHFHDRAVVTVVFKNERPSIVELVSLRKCLGKFQHISPAVLRESIGRVKRLEIGEFEGIQVRLLVEKLESNALSVVVRSSSFVSYLPVDRTTNSALLVEDSKERNELAQDMINAGVPVEHSTD
jgi:hypothetical protein